MKSKIKKTRQIRKNRWIKTIIFRDNPNLITHLNDDGWIIPNENQNNKNNDQNTQEPQLDLNSISSSCTPNSKEENSNNQPKTFEDTILENENYHLFDFCSDIDDYFDEFSNFEFNC